MPVVQTRVSSKVARQLILAGQAPSNLHVSGHLDLSGEASLRELPFGLHVLSLNLNDCVALRGLPENLNTMVLSLRRCVSLEELPASLLVSDLDLQRCSALSAWSLSEPLTLPRLNVSFCSRLRSLPETLHITEWLDVAHSGLTELSPGLSQVQIRWRGVHVDERIAFHPETVTAYEALAEANSERRRIMVERIGYERLFRECNPRLVDRDRDPGGERVLMQVHMPGDEDLLCLSVRCPSTGRPYFLRVPPDLSSCRQAAAWVAGYDKAGDFQPVLET